MKFKPKQADTVEAVQIPAGSFEIMGEKQGRMTVTEGGWLVFHPDGTVEVLSDEDFKEKYEPAKAEGGVQFPPGVRGAFELPQDITEAAQPRSSGHVPLRLKKD